MQVKDKVADFTLQTEEDKTVHLTDYRGKFVVLEWHNKTARYTDSELRRTHLGFTLQPTGLGTAAARCQFEARAFDISIR